ncbi:hypothetical protein Hanom_Chr15g01376691 [Helianthus anomalus]
MDYVVALIAERQKGTCTNRSLSRLLSVMCLMSKSLVQNYYRVGCLTGSRLCIPMG